MYYYVRNWVVIVRYKLSLFISIEKVSRDILYILMNGLFTFLINEYGHYNRLENIKKEDKT